MAFPKACVLDTKTLLTVEAGRRQTQQPQSKEKMAAAAGEPATHVNRD